MQTIYELKGKTLAPARLSVIARRGDDGPAASEVNLFGDIMFAKAPHFLCRCPIHSAYSCGKVTNNTASLRSYVHTLENTKHNVCISIPFTLTERVYSNLGS